MFPPRSCPGCNCWNETKPTLGEIPDGQYHPCCDAIEDAPCIYAVQFMCDHSWPVVTDGGTRCVGLPCGSAIAKFFYQVHCLKKECGPNCRWSEVQVVGESCADFIRAKMVPCDLVGTYFPGDQHTFPQVTPPSPMQAVRACYKEWPGFEGDCHALPVDDEVRFRLWSLDLDGTPTLSWNFTGKPGYGNPIAALAGLGKGPPVYTGSDWDATGRNNMELTNWEEWPSLPRHVCVVAVGGPGVEPVCDTEESQCNCCDDGQSTKTFGLTIDGCDRLNGCHVVESTRVTSQVAFEAAYPGANWPGSAPCGVWPLLVGTGDGCTSEEVSWGGSVLVVVYCNGSSYAGDAYCYDTNLAEWVHQGSISVTDFECIDGCVTRECGGEQYTFCCTWLIAFTLPEMDCCCPEPDPIETTCCENAVPATLTGTVTGASCSAMNGTWTLTYNSGTNEWIGTRTIGGDTVRWVFACQGIIWASFFDNQTTAFTITPGEAAAATSCDPFLWEYTSITASYDTNVATACGTASDTFDVTISE